MATDLDESFTKLFVLFVLEVEIRTKNIVLLFVLFVLAIFCPYASRLAPTACESKK